jgi:hypothetical protein
MQEYDGFLFSYILFSVCSLYFYSNKIWCIEKLVLQYTIKSIDPIGSDRMPVVIEKPYNRLQICLLQLFIYLKVTSMFLHTPFAFGFVTKQYKEMSKISYSGDIYKNTVAISIKSSEGDVTVCLLCHKMNTSVFVLSWQNTDTSSTRCNCYNSFWTGLIVKYFL